MAFEGGKKLAIEAMHRRLWAAYLPGPRSDEARAAAEAEILAARVAVPEAVQNPVIRWARSPAEARRVARELKLPSKTKAVLAANEERMRRDRSFTGDRGEFPGWLPMLQYGYSDRDYMPERMPDWDPYGRFVPAGWFDQTPRTDVLLGYEAKAALAVPPAPAPVSAAVFKAAAGIWQTPEAVMLIEHATEVHVGRWEMEWRRERRRDDEPPIMTGGLHREDGPAIVYPDGERYFFWRGRQVTEWMLRYPRLMAAIADDNAEARREALEEIGWDVLQRDTGLTQLGEDTPDPGNPGQVIRLWEFPRTIFPDGAKVLECYNGTPEADGTRRRYMLFTSMRARTPLEGAAILLKMTPEQYQTIQRRT